MGLTVKQLIDILDKPEYHDKEVYLCYDNGCYLSVEKIENWDKGYVILTEQGHSSNHWLDPKNGYTRIYDSEDVNLEKKAYWVWTEKPVRNYIPPVKDHGYGYYANSPEDAKEQAWGSFEYRYRYNDIPFTMDDLKCEELK